MTDNDKRTVTLVPMTEIRDDNLEILLALRDAVQHGDLDRARELAAFVWGTA
ncbi:hypothetical protein ACFVKB_05090 [Rhodococcus sp. NPDC127530]|uniref:hypothetical protein n=1 Tax=unclassified Rhodococcus (in: high G+C Gram-positive bacteria) TaxID=192944 RepID=UPI00362A89EE